MKADTTKHYSVRSARRRKAKNKSKAVKRTHAIRVACAIKPTEEMRKQSRWTQIAYRNSVDSCRRYSAHALYQIAMVEKNAVALKQLRALWANEVAVAMATK